jgi:hypothetical protein
LAQEGVKRASRASARPLRQLAAVEDGLVLGTPSELPLKTYPVFREGTNRTIREEHSARLRFACLGYAGHDADRPGSGFLRTKTLLKVYAFKHFP